MKNRLKVLLCHNFYQQPGGEDRVFENELWLLQANDQEVQSFTVHNDCIRDRSQLGVACDTVWNRRIARTLRDLVHQQRFDVVHFHNTFPLLSPAAWYAVRKEGAAVVQTLHNYRLVCPQATFLRNGGICTDCLSHSIPWPAVTHGCYRGRAGTTVLVSMLALHRRLGTFAKVVDRYIALTQFAANMFARGGLPAERLQVKPNFMRESPPVGKGNGSYALFVGRLTVEKGIDVLVDAWAKRANNVPLWIAGDGPMADQARQLSQARANVRWLGPQGADKVQQLMQDAMCVLIPSISYEGLPMTMVEAFAVGTPVIASRLGPLEELIQCGKNGKLFATGNGADLAAIVSDLAQSPELQRQLREGARASYVEQYGAEKNWECLEEIYRQAVANRRKSA